MRKYIFCNQLFSKITYSTQACPETVLQNKSKKVKTTEFKVPKDISQYFDTTTKTDVIDLYPEKLFKKKSKAPEGFYLNDVGTAKLISKYLTQNLPENVPLFEVNPGIGLLSREIIKTGNKNLHFFEGNEFFLNDLVKLKIQYPDSIKNIQRGDLIGLWRIAFQDKLDNGNRVSDLLSIIPKRDWKDDFNYRLYAAIGSIDFFKHLINSIVFETSILSLGRCEMYFVLPPPLYIHLTCGSSAGYLLYRATSMLFQIMFEHEFIKKIPRKHFLPWQFDYNFIKNNKLAKVNGVSPDHMYLVRIIPRKNLFDLISSEKMPALWYFIKQHCVSRKNKIIPSLEKWIPGCGTRLITFNKKSQAVKNLDANINVKSLPMYSTPSTTMLNNDNVQGINIFTQFGDLSPSQMLSLFHVFSSWPEYNQCTFLASMENSFLKMEAAAECENVSIEIPEEDDEADTNVKK